MARTGASWCSRQKPRAINKCHRMWGTVVKMVLVRVRCEQEKNKWIRWLCLVLLQCDVTCQNALHYHRGDTRGANLTPLFDVSPGTRLAMLARELSQASLAIQHQNNSSCSRAADISTHLAALAGAWAGWAHPSLGPELSVLISWRLHEAFEWTFPLRIGDRGG